jgi:hypothetical protein
MVDEETDARYEYQFESSSDVTPCDDAIDNTARDDGTNI